MGCESDPRRQTLRIVRGGGPKLPKELRDRIRALSDDVVAVLEQALHDDDVRVRLVAAQILLDRGYGRPAQATDDPDDEAQLERRVARLEPANVCGLPLHRPLVEWSERQLEALSHPVVLERSSDAQLE